MHEAMAAVGLGKMQWATQATPIGRVSKLTWTRGITMRAKAMKTMVISTAMTA